MVEAYAPSILEEGGKEDPKEGSRLQEGAYEEEDRTNTEKEDSWKGEKVRKGRSIEVCLG
jgi:hypothetical protein